MDLILGQMLCCHSAYYERCDLRYFRSAGVGDDLESQCTSLDLNTLIDKDEQGQFAFIQRWLQRGQGLSVTKR